MVRAADAGVRAITHTTAKKGSELIRVQIRGLKRCVPATAAILYLKVPEHRPGADGCGLAAYVKNPNLEGAVPLKIVYAARYGAARARVSGPGVLELKSRVARYTATRTNVKNNPGVRAAEAAVKFPETL